MENLRDEFGSLDAIEDDAGYEAADETVEEEISRQLPPAAIGQDERRMQVRAYNHWASLLDNRNFPTIEDLDPDALPDFGPYSVVLDFTAGIEDPAIQFLGKALATECGADDGMETLSDVPARSLLSRITDHYMQILANQAPIGFEAEFVNQRGATILYRGILLPFSSDDDTIDFIYGVINWKEMADQHTTDELLLEIDQALDTEMPDMPRPKPSGSPIEDWADGPAADEGSEIDGADDSNGAVDAETDDAANSDDIPTGLSANFTASLEHDYADEDDEDDSWEDIETSEDDASIGGLSNLISGGKKPSKGLLDMASLDLGDPIDPFAPNDSLEIEADEGLSVDSGDNSGAEPDSFGLGGALQLSQPIGQDVYADNGDLYDCLASARLLADEARQFEDRTRAALYAAVSRAYDFSLLALANPEEFTAMVTENGLTVQERAPLAPVVKLVFGADYDKTRLAEYAAVIAHAHRHEVETGTLGDLIQSADGGLKGIVALERDLRKEEAGKPAKPRVSKRERLAKKLRAVETRDLATLDDTGEEFGLVMIRRLENGEIVLVGDVSGDDTLFEKAARKLLN